METLKEIKEERENVPDFIYIQRLEEHCERLEKENQKLNREIGAYSGTVEALTEEFNFLVGRMKLLKNKMLGT